MSKAARLSLPYARWPAGDRRAWQAAFTQGDIFDDSGQGPTPLGCVAAQL